MAKRARYSRELWFRPPRAMGCVQQTQLAVPRYPSFTPKWSDKPLLKSYEKEKPPLGWPRTTDSLCPKCLPEIRQQIVDASCPRDSAEREGRRAEGADHRARRKDPDGEGLPNPRSLRGRHVDRPGLHEAFGRDLPRVATFAPTTTRACTTTARPPSPTDAARCSPSTSPTAAT